MHPLNHIIGSAQHCSSAAIQVLGLQCNLLSSSLTLLQFLCVFAAASSPPLNFLILTILEHRPTHASRHKPRLLEAHKHARHAFVHVENVRAVRKHLRSNNRHRRRRHHTIKIMKNVCHSFVQAIQALCDKK